MSINFKINGKKYEADGKFGPDVSLNEYIRNVADLRGTKAMCHEGGCGACVVAVRALHPPHKEPQLFSVNSCLVSVLSCQGWDITTVEGLGNRTKGYHEIQTRLAKFNGTQCGYCTPGWICNMYSLTESKKKLSVADIENSFAGNICRCTGYRPIVDAFKTFANDADESLMKKLVDLEDLHLFKPCGVQCSKKCLHEKCSKREKDSNTEADGKGNIDEREDETITEDWCIIEDNKLIEINCGDACKWYKPYNLSDVFKAMGPGTNYKFIAGNTGQGVYHVTDYPEIVIDIFNVLELKGYTIDVNLILGAAMPLTEMMQVFLDVANQNEDFSYLMKFHEHMDLVAHIPVRNIGTIGGNIYMKYENNDFQSDLFLLFETVGAMLTIAEAPNKTTKVSMMDFLKTDMKRKLILNVLLPPLSQTSLLKTYKIMPRSQNAHAVVNAGFLFKMKKDSTSVEKATIVYGSISAHFTHASNTEKVLEGKDIFSDETTQLALKTLSAEIKPEEAPPEPSAAFRKMLALSLYYKAILYLAPDDKINPKYRTGGEALKRSTSKGTQIFDTDKSVWPLNQPIPKMEALVQCSGEATFANDLPTQTGEVYGAFVLAEAVPGSMIGDFDATEALKIPGVIAFYTHKDIPGDNSFTPLNVPLVSVNEEILCSGKVLFYGQPAGIIVADREKVANKAARFVKIKYSSVNQKKPLLTTQDVFKSPEKDLRVSVDKVVEPTDTGNDVKSRINGEMVLKTQYHYTMEPQTCVVKPVEGGYEVYSSTQWLDVINVAIAQCLKVPINSVNVIVRRVGGAYGAKITRSGQIACAAALVSHLQGKPCRIILSIETNMRAVGKRVPTYCNFDVAVNSDGEIQHLDIKYYQENGCSANENISTMTLNHIKNCYDIKRWHLEACSVATDTPSNTWCRSPSSTEGVAIIENVMERIAFNLGKDPMDVRMLNMAKHDNPIPDLLAQIKSDSNYYERMEQVKTFNENNRWRKRAIKIIPMTFDTFYIGPFNCLINIFNADGSVAVTHAGVEMGQGINTKVAQVVAFTLGIPLEKVSVKASNNFTSPNSAPTGASIGSECVAYAAVKACNIILERLKPIREKEGNIPWEELIKKAFYSGIELQASGTFTIFDGVKTYDIYGAVVMEIELDILSGNHDVLRVDLLEDVGRSLNPEIDVGQIEGAFVMGLGYWTSEQISYDRDTGRLLTDRTWTYKPPGIKDIPADFRIYFRRNSRNPFGVLQSKATGEPALCLAVVVAHALREAARAARLDAGYQDQWVDIKNPCTVENIFMAIEHKIEHFKLK